MKFHLFFIVCLLFSAAFLPSEAAPKWKGWKKIVSRFILTINAIKKNLNAMESGLMRFCLQEKAGKRVFNVAEKVLPVATGYKALG